MGNFLPDDLPNLIIVYDSQWKIKTINAAAIALLAYSDADELTGKPLKTILHESEYGHIKTLCQTLENKKSKLFSQEIRHLRKDGKWIRIFSQFSIIRDKQDPDKNAYIQSGFYVDEQKLQDHQLANFHHLHILAENVPGLMMLLVDKNHSILCRVGSETKKREEEGEQYKTLKEELPKNIIDILQPLIKIAFEGTSVSREFHDGNNYYSVRLLPISDQKTNDLCVIMLQDISETKLIENKLKISKKAAEAASNEKTAFIANMSHEIRTPLNAIIGFTEQLAKTKLTKKQAAYLDVVNNSSHHLLSTINDILVLSKIESGDNETDNEPFVLTEIIETVQDIFALRSKEKKLDFQVNFDPSIKGVLLGDPAKIRQVLINLVANAIKFTHQGGVLLSCSLIKDTQETLTIHFDVTDTGIGISEEELKNIFEPFHQADNSLDRSYFGSGLGLTISNNYLKSMGGKIAVKSTPEKGSTFSFTLSFQKSTRQLTDDTPDKSLLPPTLPDQVRILFTDDDPVSRMLGEVILKQYNTKCVFAKSGEEAVKKFKPGCFDIVLLDINMPGMSGVEVAKHIRIIESNNENLPHTKIIAMTANVVRKHIQEYLKAGMNDFLLKPFNEQDLIKKIALYSTENNSVPAQPKESEKTVSEDEDYNLDALLQITQGDKEYTLLMLDTFIENGKSVLEQMQQASRTEDYHSIAEAAHSLHPSVEQLGFKKTTSMLKRIESRYLRKNNFKKDPEMIEHTLNEVASCIEKINIARDHYS